MSQKFDAIWSTPWVKFLRPYGVLQNELQCPHSITIWSAPSVKNMMPYGVLHGSNIWGLMECFKIYSRGFILLTYGVLHGSKI